MERHIERVEHQHWLTAIVASTIANHGFRQLDKWAVPSDYMPSQKQKRERKPRINRKRIADDIRMIMRAKMDIQNNG